MATPQSGFTASPSKGSRQQRPWEKAAVPIELVATSTSKKGVLYVFAYLQVFDAPSICTLAAIAGMSDRDVRSCLKWLEAEGWIQKIQRPGGTNQYRVFFERVGAYRG